MRRIKPAVRVNPPVRSLVGSSFYHIYMEILHLSVHFQLFRPYLLYAGEKMVLKEQHDVNTIITAYYMTSVASIRCSLLHLFEGGQCQGFKSILLRLSLPCYVCVCQLTAIFCWISVTRSLIPLCSLNICHRLSFFLRMALPHFIPGSLCWRFTDYWWCMARVTGHMAAAAWPSSRFRDFC